MYIVSTYILNHIKQKRLQAIANRVEYKCTMSCGP